MEIYYKDCLCIYGTYRVMSEDKPVFFLKENPVNAEIWKLGFEEVKNGLWCHFLTEEEYDRMERYLESEGK